MSRAKTCHDMPVFETQEAAQAALDKFAEIVAKARDELGLHHVFVLGCPVVRVDDENVTVMQGAHRIGSDTELLFQLASAYGRMRNQFEEGLTRALSKPSKAK